MATYTKHFDSYKMWKYSNFHYTHLIYCYDGNEYVGRLNFHPDGEDLPQNSQSNGSPTINYHSSDIDFVVEMLRHESPLYLFYSDSNHVGILGTASNEPIGEEE